MRDDLWRLLMLNTRLPEALDGDLRAMIGSTRIGAERLAAAGRGAGRRARAAISSKACWPMPTAASAAASRGWPRACGAPRSRSTTTASSRSTARSPSTLTVKDDGLIVDFAGTTPQIRGFKNSSIANSTSAVYMALSSFFEPDLPQQRGHLPLRSRSACPKARW